jgi:monolysocardiolipin acyltransferase
MSLVSTATITVIGLTCKAFLNLGLVSCSVNGLSTLLHTLTSKSRDHGQGVLTG